MATFVPVPNVAEVAVVQDLDGQKVINTFHIYSLDGWGVGALTDLCIFFTVQFAALFAPHQSAELNYVKVMARDLTTDSGAVAEINFADGSNGDVNQAALPCQNSYSVAHTTGRAGRSFRGRTSFSGIPIGSVADNLVADAYATVMQDRCLDLQGALGARGWIWGVASRYHGYTQTAPKYKKVPTPRDPAIFTEFTNHSGTRRIGSQDSRNK